MSIQTARISENMRHALGGGDLSVELDKFQVLNEAGEYLHAMHAWNWARGRSALLDLRGSLSGTTATWTAATKTLTATGAFTSYAFLAGDEIEITAGTGATTGVYTVASRTSANAIVLTTSLSSVDLSTGDIAWSIFPSTIALPEDLRDIISIAPTRTSNRARICLTSLDHINQNRGANALVQSPALFYGAVVYTGATPTPILELWPSPGANETGAMRIFYTARWVRQTNDFGVIAIPEFMENLLTFICRAFAQGYEREAESSLHKRLAEIQAGPVYAAAVRSDGEVQAIHGRPRGGGAEVWGRRRRYGGFNSLINLPGQPV
jgi:hypothetical protein